MDQKRHLTFIFFHVKGDWRAISFYKVKPTIKVAFFLMTDMGRVSLPISTNVEIYDWLVLFSAPRPIAADAQLAKIANRAIGIRRGLSVPDG